MNTITKSNFLNQLQLNVNELLSVFKRDNVDNSTTDYCEIINNKKGEVLAEVSFLTNGGDVRQIKLFIFTKNEKKNNANFMIDLYDYSVGRGKYSPIFKDTFGSPLAMQIETFDMKKTSKLFQLERKASRYGKELEFDKEIETILEPLSKLFFRSKETLSDYYSNLNKNSNIEAFNSRKSKPIIYEDNFKIEDLEHFTAYFEK